jgi:Serine aminopeptidase, S33
MNCAAEQVLRFGPQQRLLGIFNHRPGDAPVACLLLNVGVTQRIGPRRLNVKLARALASRSISSLRFDLSGIGDSGAGGAEDEYRSQAVADFSAAMDHLEQTAGIRRFIVLGICSGAVNGYRVVQQDPRVVGLMMFDGYAYPTSLTRMIHDWRRLRSTPASALLGKLVNRGRKLLGLATVDQSVSIFYATKDDSSPDRDAFAGTLDAVAARGVHLLIAYSGSLLALHNHESQFRRAFAGRSFLARTENRYLPQIDHIPTSQAAQAEFVSMVCAWTAGVIASPAA